MLDTNPREYLKSWLAELLGTFFLLLAILAAPRGFAFVVAGAVLLVLVVALGKVSGSHLNPAVTAALVSSRRFPLRDGAAYIPAQIIGALLAILLAGSLGYPVANVGRGANAFLAELIGAFLLAFVVTQVTYHQVPETGSALGIGLALGLGVLLAGPRSGGVINPAIGLALLLTGNVSSPLGGLFVYLLAPLLGGLLAAPVAGYFAPVRVPERDPRKAPRSL